ncbi:MAG: type II toxin-antitoxin system Phd/YefM family antitoxin [Vicinamibacterales bacterium]
MTATEFKAKCLAVIDRVHSSQETVAITKRGRVVAKLVPEVDTAARPWLTLRGGRAIWHGDPFQPAVAATDIEALK